ncbi:MAG TPA: PD-(D/E)XK nuclease family protein [Bryobacteraceae bacterium]|nr:PD-(D/E)XK nuclease family protein [Bryobacteraceae bacterium]
MRIIRGAPGTGKTALVLGEFRQTLTGRIIVPTATLVRHLQHELARDGAVFSPAAVTSLHHFCQECAPDVRVVPDALLRAIVRDCLHAAHQQTNDGMISTVIETIELLENQGRKPSKAFARLSAAIDEAIAQRGFVTRRGLIEAAAAGIPPGLRIWMDGFLNFSALEAGFVAALVRRADLTLTVATPELHKLGLQLGARDHLLSGRARWSETLVVEARIMEREVEDIAARIASAGVPFRRIAVALRDTSYVPLLQSTFERFGIPARFYFSHPLKTHPAAVFLSGLIDGALAGWDFESTLTTLRAHPRWGHSADFDRLDFRIREAMPGHGAEAFLSHCESEWLREAISRCFAIDSWRHAPAAPAAWQQRLENLAAGLYRPSGIGPDLAAARSHVAALHAWVEAIGSIAAWWPDSSQPIRLEDYWRIAAAAIETAVFQIPDDRAEAVHVMSVYEARQWDVSVLFLCGLLDRDFPKRWPPNLLFPDLIQSTEADERALFDALVTRASDTLVLSYPTHDTSGKGVARSRFLDNFPDPVPALRAKPETAPAPPPGEAGRIAAPALLGELTRLHQTVSLTALEDLAQCRFKFFSSRTLKLESAPDPPGKRLQPKVTGSILHAALEQWQHNRHRDFVELYEEAFENACREYRLPPGYRLEVERIWYREIARKISATEKWHPDSSDAEVELILDLPDGIAARCRIDRIDRFGDDCVIVDYKSSKTENVERLVESKTRLQGPLYALAVRQRLGLRPIAMVYWAVREDELFGWGRIPGSSVELKEMPADWAIAARDRIADRLAGYLHRGSVAAQPEEPAECRYCDFRHACRVGEQPALVRIAGGPE